METSGKVRVTIYSRPGCHLCHEAEAAIRGSACQQEVEIEIVNIDDDANLRERYGYDIPVVFINGIKVFKYRISPEEFCRKVRRLRKRMKITPPLL
ncbi:MAG: glutaredoxin family protein [Acidobacteria bacterium]|nr:glutaredoxin family protein [Acidobacteriota bacterium]